MFVVLVGLVGRRTMLHHHFCAAERGNIHKKLPQNAEALPTIGHR
jgi:hypothetical protein